VTTLAALSIYKLNINLSAQRSISQQGLLACDKPTAAVLVCYITLPGILADKQQVKVAPAVDVLLTLFSAIPSCLLDVTS